MGAEHIINGGYRKPWGNRLGIDTYRYPGTSGEFCTRHKLRPNKGLRRERTNCKRSLRPRIYDLRHRHAGRHADACKSVCRTLKVASFYCARLGLSAHPVERRNVLAQSRLPIIDHFQYALLVAFGKVLLDVIILFIETAAVITPAKSQRPRRSRMRQILLSAAMAPVTLS